MTKHDESSSLGTHVNVLSICNDVTVALLTVSYRIPCACLASKTYGESDM